MSAPGIPYSSGRNSPEKALQKLKHFCGYQERSHAEVKEKAYSLGMFKKEVDELIAQLIEEGYLNEERFASQYVSGKLRIKGWGKQKIRYALLQKKISVYNVTKALKSIDEDEYLLIFNRQAEKKWRLLHAEKNIFVKKHKWQQYLLQKGFEPALLNSWPIPGKDGTGALPN